MSEATKENGSKTALKRRKQTALKNSDFQTLFSRYAALSGIFVLTWAWASLLFGLGYLSYFGTWTAKYFSLLDLQYHSFSYVAYIIPVSIFLIACCLQFIEPAPNHNGEIKPLYEHVASDLRRPIAYLALVLFVSICLFLILWPWLIPDIRLFFPEGSILRDFVFIDPIVLFVFFQSILAAIFLIASGDKVKNHLRTVFVISSVILSGTIYVIGDTVAAYSAEGRLSSEIAYGNSKRIGAVMIAGSQFTLVKPDKKTFELVNNSKIDRVSPELIPGI